MLLVCNLIVETRCILLEADDFDARNKPDFNVRNESRLKLIAAHEHSYFAFSLKNERDLSNEFSKQILLHADSHTPGYLRRYDSVGYGIVFRNYLYRPTRSQRERLKFFQNSTFPPFLLRHKFDLEVEEVREKRASARTKSKL